MSARSHRSARDALAIPIPAPEVGGSNALSRACQTGRHPISERGLDFYSTPAIAVDALLGVEKLPQKLWEPAAGRGAVVQVLRARGHKVIASDIVNHGFDLHFVADFFRTSQPPIGCKAIVTNPPYRDADDFVRHALDLVPRVYLLLRLAFLESVRRTDIIEHGGLRTVHVFRKRLPMMHRHGWRGRTASSAIPFAWFVWDRDHLGPAIMDRV